MPRLNVNVRHGAISMSSRHIKKRSTGSKSGGKLMNVEHQLVHVGGSLENPTNLEKLRHSLKLMTISGRTPAKGKNRFISF